MWRAHTRSGSSTDRIWTQCLSGVIQLLLVTVHKPRTVIISRRNLGISVLRVLVNNQNYEAIKTSPWNANTQKTQVNSRMKLKLSFLAFILDITLKQINWSDELRRTKVLPTPEYCEMWPTWHLSNIIGSKVKMLKLFELCHCGREFLD